MQRPKIGTDVDHIRKEHREARRDANSAATSVGSALISAPLSHGTSLFGLLFSIPKLIYYTRKQGKLKKQLRIAGVAPLPRTKRDYLIPAATGTITAVLGAGVPGLEHAQHGVAHLAQAHTSIAQQGAQHGANGVELFGKGVAQAIQQHAHAIAHPEHLFHDGLQNMWMEGNYIEPNVHGLQAFTDAAGNQADILHVGVRDMLLNWDVGGQFVQEGLPVEHILGGIAHIDALIDEVMNHTFTQLEMQAIGNNLTAAAIGEVMGGVLDSAAYQGFSVKDDVELKRYFRESVLAASKNFQRQKQIILSLDDMEGIASQEKRKGKPVIQLPTHIGIQCTSCVVFEIQGTRFHCADCEGEINFCFNCFMAERNQNQVMSHRWIEYLVSEFDLRSPLKTGIEISFEEKDCMVCFKTLTGDYFKCRDCDQVYFCKSCFIDQNKTLHENCMFVLVSPYGFMAVNRGSYLFEQ